MDEISKTDIANKLDKSDKIDIKSYNLKELKALLESRGEKAFRANQIYDWLHKKCVCDPDLMLNISKDLKNFLKNECIIDNAKELELQESKLDGTRKYLFALSDGNVVESVLMKYHHGNSVCISSQVGCRMGCKFCASTLDGLVRNLTPSEMLDQIYKISQSIGERISNVVVMGTGEPMDNFDNLVKFIELLTDENGLNISQRNITVSTCGIVPKIKELADKKLQITLALSLHGATDEKRQALMPIAQKYSLKEVMEACDYYYDKTGRRMTFEYSLVGEVNDTDEDLNALCTLCGGKNVHINLIPVNPIKERTYVQSNKQRIQSFKNKLEKNAINVTIRREMGRDIDGACGQLRRRYIRQENVVSD